MADAIRADASEGPSVQLAVSNAMVRLYKEQLGRGPTKARTHFAGRDLVICTLENSFTPAERNLVRLGEHQRVRDTRMVFQYATEGKFRRSIEEITGRKVVASVSGTDVAHDVSAELFYLAPEADGNGAGQG